MSLKFLPIALLFLMAAFISCDRSDDKDVTPSIPKIKTITRTTATSTTIHTYHYDGLGRISKLTGSDKVSVQYVYQKDRIIRIDSLQQQTDTLLLNDKGLVVSAPNYWITREYNPDGYLVKLIFSNPQGQFEITSEYKVTDGNISTYEVWAFQKLSDSYDYLYLPNSTNTIGNENKGTNFYGKQDKNLVSSFTAMTHSTGDWLVVNYRYELDAQNRVVKRYTISPTGDVYEAYTYY